MATIVRISELKAHDGDTVTLQGWLYNSRGKGKIMFLLLRDGSGICQCVTVKAVVGEERFAELKALGQESSLTSISRDCFLAAFLGLTMTRLFYVNSHMRDGFCLLLV